MDADDRWDRRFGRLIQWVSFAGLLAMLALLVLANDDGEGQGSKEAAASTASGVIIIVGRAAKVSQLIGDYDRERYEPTLNQTGSRYRLYGTDLGVPFEHNGRTYVLFGDAVGAGRHAGDSIAVTDDLVPEDGIDLEFLASDSGVYSTIRVSDISLGPSEVPMDGVSS